MSKINKIISTIAIILAILAYCIYMFQEEEMDKSFLNNYEEFIEYELVNNNPIVYEVILQNNEVGYLVFGSEYGYQSNIIMATLINNNGEIINVRTYSENETPAFYKRLYDRNFFEKNFFNKGIQEGFSIDTNVDSITSSTISSNAVSKAIHKSSSYIGKNYLSISVDNPYGSIKFGIVDLSILVMFALVIFSYLTKNKHLRTITLLYSFIILGFKFMQFISYSTFLSLITLNMPSIYDNLRWYLLFFGSLLLILFTGKNLYCTYICPFGAMQQLEFKFAKLNFFKLNKNVRKILMVIPGYIAWFAFVIALSSGNISATNYEPFSLVFGRVGIGVQWLLLPITVFMSLIVMTFYCNYGCPVGYSWNLLLKFRRRVVKYFGKIKS